MFRAISIASTSSATADRWTVGRAQSRSDLLSKSAVDSGCHAAGIASAPVTTPVSTNKAPRRYTKSVFNLAKMARDLFSPVHCPQLLHCLVVAAIAGAWERRLLVFRVWQRSSQVTLPDLFISAHATENVAAPKQHKEDGHYRLSAPS